MQVTLHATVIGVKYAWDVDVPEGTPQMLIDAARKGYQEWLQDAGSTTKGTPAKKKASMDERDVKIKDGTYTHGTGRGAPRMAWEDKAERDILEAIFVAIGEKVVIAKKSAAADNAWERVTRLTLLQQYAAEGKTPDEIKQMDLKALVAESLDAVRELYADDIADKAEKLKAAAEKKPALKTIPKGIKVGE